MSAFLNLARYDDPRHGPFLCALGAWLPLVAFWPRHPSANSTNSNPSLPEVPSNFRDAKGDESWQYKKGFAVDVQSPKVDGSRQRHSCR
jgi:hypothetical protein